MERCTYCGGAAGHEPGCPAGAEGGRNAPRSIDELPAWAVRKREGKDACRFCGGADAHGEDCSLADPEHPDFNNLDLTDAVMASGDMRMIARLRDFVHERGMDDKRFAVALEAQRLRNEVHGGMKRSLEDRIRSRRPPTTEELSMGAFVEAIEPQAREAMLSMRRKGFATTSSGFGSFDIQSVVLGTPDLLDLTTDERSALEALGVEFFKEMDGFSFRCAEVDIGKIKEAWDAVAAALPDLGRPAPDAGHGAARSFRKKYGGEER